MGHPGMLVGVSPVMVDLGYVTMYVLPEVNNLNP